VAHGWIRFGASLAGMARPLQAVMEQASMASWTSGAKVAGRRRHPDATKERSL
jgi:hypothetical protein